MHTLKLWMVLPIVIILSLIFIFIGAEMNFDYIIPKRLIRLGSIFIGGICVALSSIVFQTLVNNRILTPAIMGYESIYLFWQALLLLVLGYKGLAILGLNGNFIISIILILIYSWFIQHWVLSSKRKDMYQALLLGIVLSMVITTFTQFIQLRISPGEFSVFQGMSYTTFNRTQPEMLLYAAIALGIVCFAGYKSLPVLDVLALGREQAISLGIDYTKYSRFYLILVAILVAVSTSLIGPTAFMGIFIANITYELASSSKHRIRLPLACAIAVTLFILAQLLVEYVFNYKTTVSILINLVCGLYFLIFIVRARGAI